MCVDPATALMAASGVAKAASSVFGGIAAKRAAQANAALADENAAYANRQAGDSIDRGSDEAAKQYLQSGRVQAEQTAAMAANGIELGFGSPLEVVAGTAIMGEMDAGAIRENARREAEAYRIQALNARQQAESYRAAGRNALLGGFLDATGSLLSTASQVAGMSSSQPNTKLVNKPI